MSTPTIVTAARNFMSQGMKTDDLSPLSLNDLKDKLRDERLTEATRQYTKELHQHSLRLQDKPMVCTRIKQGTFLAAFNMYYKAGEFLVGTGPLVFPAYAAACDLVKYMNKITPQLANDTPLADVPLKEFVPLVNRFRACFSPWFAENLRDFMVQVKKGLTGLYLGYPTIPDSEPAESRLRTEFDREVRRLRGMIVKTDGQDELARFDEELSAAGITLHLTLGV
jgi:hypothetical protein